MRRYENAWLHNGRRLAASEGGLGGSYESLRSHLDDEDGRRRASPAAKREHRRRSQLSFPEEPPRRLFEEQSAGAYSPRAAAIKGKLLNFAFGHTATVHAALDGDPSLATPRSHAGVQSLLDREASQASSLLDADPADPSFQGYATPWGAPSPAVSASSLSWPSPLPAAFAHHHDGGSAGKPRQPPQPQAMPSSAHRQRHSLVLDLGSPAADSGRRSSTSSRHQDGRYEASLHVSPPVACSCATCLRRSVSRNADVWLGRQMSAAAEDTARSIAPHPATRGHHQQHQQHHSSSHGRRHTTETVTAHPPRRYHRHHHHLDDDHNGQSVERLSWAGPYSHHSIAAQGRDTTAQHSTTQGRETTARHTGGGSISRARTSGSGSSISGDALHVPPYLLQAHSAEASGRLRYRVATSMLSAHGSLPLVAAADGLPPTAWPGDSVTDDEHSSGRRRLRPATARALRGRSGSTGRYHRRAALPGPLRFRSLSPAVERRAATSAARARRLRSRSRSWSPARRDIAQQLAASPKPQSRRRTQSPRQQQQRPTPLRSIRHPAVAAMVQRLEAGVAVPAPPWRPEPSEPHLSAAKQRLRQQQQPWDGGYDSGTSSSDEESRAAARRRRGHRAALRDVRGYLSEALVDQRLGQAGRVVLAQRRDRAWLDGGSDYGYSSYRRTASWGDHGDEQDDDDDGDDDDDDDSVMSEGSDRQYAGLVRRVLSSPGRPVPGGSSAARPAPSRSSQQWRGRWTVGGDDRGQGGRDAASDSDERSSDGGAADRATARGPKLLTALHTEGTSLRQLATYVGALEEQAKRSRGGSGGSGRVTFSAGGGAAVQRGSGSPHGGAGATGGRIQQRASSPAPALHGAAWQEHVLRALQSRGRY